MFFSFERTHVLKVNHHVSQGRKAFSVCVLTLAEDRTSTHTDLGAVRQRAIPGHGNQSQLQASMKRGPGWCFQRSGSSWESGGLEFVLDVPLWDKGEQSWDQQWTRK